MRAAGMTSVISVVVASLVGFTTPAPTEQPESYIVELAEGASVEEVIADAPVDVEPTETYEALGEGFAAELTSDEVAELEALPEVVAVYEDLPMSVGATQSSAPWNLSRLDQSTAPADTFYTYPDSAGSGARVYVVDTGVSPNAGQLGGRLLPGISEISGDTSTADCNGHGTHVAGTVASSTWGVAKQASIVPVRVFGCSGDTFTSTVISGLDWIVANHPGGTPGIINMSLGSTSPIARTTPDALTNKVNQLADLGFIVVVAAGNNGADACDYSPSRATKAITVAATTETDARAGFSNYGSCVDLFAPGSNIRSLRWDNPAGSMVMQGTSMAAPHVAGVAALGWATQPTASAAVISSSLIDQALIGVVTSPGTGSPNKLTATTALIGGPIAYPTSPGARAILNVYFANGGPDGEYGAPTTPLQELQCSSIATRCVQFFENGAITWDASNGVLTVTSEFAAYWSSRGGSSGVLGNPINAAQSFSTVNGDGKVQIFQGGYVYSSAAGVFTVRPNQPWSNAWAAAGWIRGSLGWPTGEESCSGGVCQQQFQGGVIRGSTILPLL